MSIKYKLLEWTIILNVVFIGIRFVFADTTNEILKSGIELIVLTIIVSSIHEVKLWNQLT